MKSRDDLTSSKTLLKSSMLNLSAYLIPLFISLAAMPVFSREIDVPRFGLLALLWGLFGYFNLFEFGLGQAMTKLLADRIGQDDLHSVPKVLCTTLVIVALIGLTAAILIVSSTSYIIDEFISAPADLKSEFTKAVLVIGVSVLFIVPAGSLRGLLQVFQMFKHVSIGRSLVGIFLVGGPLACLPVTDHLMWLAVSMVFGRFLSFVLYMVKAREILRSCGGPFTFDASLIHPLFSYGGWVTVSAVVGPIMVYMDRMIIGFFLSPEQVAFYSVPSELIIRSLVFVGAFCTVLFPAFAMLWNYDKQRVIKYYASSSKIVFILLLPIFFILNCVTPEFLTLYLTPTFAEGSTVVFRLLCIGVLINSMAFVPITYIRSCGRPDIPAKLHLFELCIYIVMLYIGVRFLSIRGVALAWTLRVLLDTSLLLYFSSKIMKTPLTQIFSSRTLSSLLYFPIMILFFFINDSAWRWTILGVFICIFPIHTLFVLNASEKKHIRNIFLLKRNTQYQGPA